MLAQVAKVFDRLPPLGLVRIAQVDKVSDHTHLKIITPKKMVQRLPIALAQLKSGNTSENLLNEICQIIYSLHQAKEITKQLYNKLTNSIKV